MFREPFFSGHGVVVICWWTILTATHDRPAV